MNRRNHLPDSGKMVLGLPLALVCRGVRTDSGRVSLELYCPRCGCQSHVAADGPFVVSGGALVKGGGR